MSTKKIINRAASVRQKILNKARKEQRPFAELLQYYSMERFLYRLSKSTHAKKFILKGALMLWAWKSPKTRPTLDIDMLGKTSNNGKHIIELVRDICSTRVEADGLLFDLDSLHVETIIQDAEYNGVRVLFFARLDTAKVAMQIDIGFGDIVYPRPEKVELPSLLDFPPPNLLGYSRESVIAEKLNAIITLGEINSRMKDFYDIWLLSKMFSFKGENLTEAIKRTLEHRGTQIPARLAAFSEPFLTAKVIQWNAFVRKLRQKQSVPEFGIIINSISVFLTPILETLRKGGSFSDDWDSVRHWY
jgi:hypothetical protein